MRFVKRAVQQVVQTRRVGMSVTTKKTAPTTLTLTPAERELRDVCVNTADWLRERGQGQFELRFAGGWVRDKLLSRSSHDVDVAIDKMSGYEFAQAMSEYASTHVQSNDPGMRSIGKIKSNPDKSKHLETATTTLFGLDADFVNLRCETYSTDSRIPEMTFGTPEQDAMRRDATINALFYNLHTGQVEDFTGRGLQDLADGVLRTPLAALQTFHDDPLRVLRLVRFAARYNFTLDAEAAEAARDPDIQLALRTKISHERVGVEVDKMLQASHPEKGLSLLNELGLVATVFDAPPIDPSTYASLLALARALDVSSICRFADCERYLFWLTVALLPWASYSGQIGKRLVNMPAAIVRERLKLSAALTDQVQGVFTQLPLSFPSIDASRSEIAFAVRQRGSAWRVCLALQIIQNHLRRGASQLEDDEIAPFRTMVDTIDARGLAQAYTIKPLLDGKTLQREGLATPGPGMKEALDIVLRWQFDHPEATTDMCIAAMRKAMR